MGISLENCRITIHPMVADDVDEVHRIECLSFLQPWSKGAFYSELTNNQFALYLVARRGGCLVGYSGMWVIRDEAHVTTLAVKPEYRQKGLGSMLLQVLIDCADALKAVRMTLEVRISNERALLLYERQGFVIRGIRKKYYEDEDAYIMWKDDLNR